MHPEQLKLFAEIEDTHWWFAARRHIVARLVERIFPGRARARILDIGCGTGANLGELAERHDCIGMDASPTAIELARRRIPGVTFQQGSSAEAMEPVAAGVNLLLMMDVLEHVADDFLFFSALLAAAAPGTCFLITVPADMTLWSRHDETVLHYRRYDRGRLQSVWTGLPVRVRLLSYFNSRLYPAIKLARMVARIRRRSFGDAGTDFTTPRAWLNRMLRAIFAGESDALVRTLDRPGTMAYRRGVSLIALLERQKGDLSPRTKPPGVAPDPYLPSANS